MEIVLKAIAELCGFKAKQNRSSMFDIFALSILMPTMIKTQWWDPISGRMGVAVKLLTLILIIKIIFQGRDVKLVKVYRTKKLNQKALSK